MVYESAGEKNKSIKHSLISFQQRENNFQESKQKKKKKDK